MPNDRSTFVPQRLGLARLLASPPAYFGNAAASRAVQQAIVDALAERGPVLVHGASGTGKRTVAEILHHFGGGDIPRLESVSIDARGRCGSIGDFAYLCPVEQLSVAEQDALPNRVGLSRLIIGTRLDPNSREGRARLSGTLLRWCRTRIALPSLAERIEDLELIAMMMLPHLPARAPIGGISEDAVDCLCGYDWPGNVSELESVLRFALGRARGASLDVEDLPPRLVIRAVGEVSPRSPEQVFSLANAEREAVRRAMRHARGNKRRAARLLQIGKTTLYRKLALL